MLRERINYLPNERTNDLPQQVGRRRNWKNQGFLKQRKLKMVRTEQLKYIQLLHERGEGSLKISKRLDLSRNTVRKYLALLDSGQPIVFVSNELTLWIPMKN